MSDVTTALPSHLAEAGFSVVNPDRPPRCPCCGGCGVTSLITTNRIVQVDPSRSSRRQFFGFDERGNTTRIGADTLASCSAQGRTIPCRVCREGPFHRLHPDAFCRWKAHADQRVPALIDAAGVPQGTCVECWLEHEGEL